MTPFTARRTPVHKGPAAWSAILPGQPTPLPLPGNQTVDVAIIGGGFAGLAAARRLRQLDPTLTIAVLEASRLAEGASGRNSGFMIDLPLELTSDDYTGHGDDRCMTALIRQAIAFTRAGSGRTVTTTRCTINAGKVILANNGHQEQSWAGHLCLTRNAVSIAREMASDLYAATVRNGLGTACSTLTGITAAELAMGLQTVITRHFAAEAEPTKLPPKPFSTIGANVFLRLKEWRAGAE